MVATLVMGGLAGSAGVNVWIEPPDTLPGVALGSHALLAAERSVAFFSIWLLGLVVVAQAIKGRLPIEVSGRGIRYADGPATLTLADRADSGIDDLLVEVGKQRDELNELQLLVATDANER